MAASVAMMDLIASRRPRSPGNRVGGRRCTRGTPHRSPGSLVRRLRGWFTVIPLPSVRIGHDERAFISRHVPAVSCTVIRAGWGEARSRGDRLPVGDGGALAVGDQMARLSMDLHRVRGRELVGGWF